MLNYLYSVVREAESLSVESVYVFSNDDDDGFSVELVDASVHRWYSASALTALDIYLSDARKLCREFCCHHCRLPSLASSSRSVDGEPLFAANLVYIAPSQHVRVSKCMCNTSTFDRLIRVAATQQLIIS